MEVPRPARLSFKLFSAQTNTPNDQQLWAKSTIDLTHFDNGTQSKNIMTLRPVDGCIVTGEVNYEILLKFNSDLPHGQFKKRDVDHLYDSRKSSQTFPPNNNSSGGGGGGGSGGGNKARMTLFAPNTKIKLNLFKSKKTRRFGVNIDPSSDSVPEIIVSTISYLEAHGSPFPSFL